MNRRRIRLFEPVSGLDAIADLNDAGAPRHAAVLWQLAGQGHAFDALHAMWTGPEISCQIAADIAPPDLAPLTPERATSHPAAGDIALVAVGPGAWSAMPAGFLDLGLFYADGARLLLPHGWVEASIAASVAPAGHAALADACGRIRRNGACRLHLAQCP